LNRRAEDQESDDLLNRRPGEQELFFEKDSLDLLVSCLLKLLDLVISC
jgi:hypothetical protein